MINNACILSSYGSHLPSDFVLLTVLATKSMSINVQVISVLNGRYFYQRIVNDTQENVPALMNTTIRTLLWLALTWNTRTDRVRHNPHTCVENKHPYPINSTSSDGRSNIKSIIIYKSEDSVYDTRSNGTFKAY